MALVIGLTTILLASCAGPRQETTATSDQRLERMRDATTRLAEQSVQARPAPSPLHSPVLPVSYVQTGEVPTPTSVHPELVSPPLPDRGMSLEQIFQHTLDHHPLVQARAHELEAARARLATASLLPNPRWVMDSESPVASDDVTRLSSRLTFELPTGRKRSLGMAASQAGITRTQAALAYETLTLLLDVADAAAEVLYLQELVVLQEHMSQLAAQTEKLVEGQYQGGTSPYTALLRSQLDASEIALRRLEILGRLEQSRVRLSRAAGLPPAPLISLQGTLPVTPIPAIDLSELLAVAASQAPELAESRAALLESQRRHSQACAEARPDIEIGPRVHNELGRPDDRVGARLSVDLPLFDRNQGQIAESAAVVRTRRAMLDAVEINTLSDVAEAYLRLQAAQRQLEYCRLELEPLVQRSEAVVRGAAADTVLAPVQLSELLQQVVQMRIEQLDLRYVHARLRMQLELLLGCRLESLAEAAGVSTSER